METPVHSIPEVSVIIPIYNVERYLPTCLDSVRNQTLRDIEIILVDDGSPDGCPAMCDEYARLDHRVKVIHKRNAGLGFARNSGLEIATGRWICFIDSDDYIALNTLAVCVSIGDRTGVDQVRYLSTDFSYDTHPEPAVVDSSDEAVVLSAFPDKVFPMFADITNVPAGMHTDVVAVASAWGGIYRRSALTGSGVLFPSERELISEDNIFNIEFAAVSGAIAYTQNRFYFYRHNPVSLTTSFRRDRVERSAIFCRHLEKRMNVLGYPSLVFISHSIMLGYLRTHLWHLFMSGFSESEKRRLHREAVNHPYLDEIAAEGTYRQLPTLQRLAFDCRRSYILSKLLVKGREMLRFRK